MVWQRDKLLACFLGEKTTCGGGRLHYTWKPGAKKTKYQKTLTNFHSPIADCPDVDYVRCFHHKGF
jgi:hypothetical protein